MNRKSLSSIAIPSLAIALFAALPAQAAGASLEIFPDERIFYLIVLFVLLIFPVNKLLFHPIFRVLDERDARIDGAPGTQPVSGRIKAQRVPMEVSVAGPAMPRHEMP